MLGKVRILILVDQYETEKAPVLLQHIRMVAKQDIRLQQQIVKIHRPGLQAAVLIPFVYLAHQRDF